MILILRIVRAILGLMFGNALLQLLFAVFYVFGIESKSLFDEYIESPAFYTVMLVVMAIVFGLAFCLMRDLINRLYTERYSDQPSPLLKMWQL